MAINKDNTLFNITVYGKPIQQVTEFDYIGHKLSSLNAGLVPLKHKIGLNLATFAKDKSLLTSSHIP